MHRPPLGRIEGPVHGLVELADETFFAISRVRGWQTYVNVAHRIGIEVSAAHIYQLHP